MQIIGIIGVIALAFYIVTGAALLLYTALAIFACGCIGAVVSFFYFQGKLDRQREQFEAIREQDHQRTLEIFDRAIAAARATGSRVDAPNVVNIPKSKIKVIDR